MSDICIKGVQKTTLIDYPGTVACTIFLSRCNFRCKYCYNQSLVNDSKDLEIIPEKEMLDFLKERKKWLDGVCITGGEPCMHSGLPEFLEKIKKLGYKIKLDTNGTNTWQLKELIEKKLIDYIAMDIKTSLKKYNLVTQVKVPIETIKKSIELIMGSNVDYEFRSTVAPGIIDESDIKDIGKMLSGAKNFFIQQYKEGLDTVDPKFSKVTPYPIEKLELFKRILEKDIQKVSIRQ
jgi:pyruvate formate lyase activating enzyme